MQMPNVTNALTFTPAIGNHLLPPVTAVPPAQNLYYKELDYICDDSEGHLICFSIELLGDNKK